MHRSREILVIKPIPLDSINDFPMVSGIAKPKRKLSMSIKT